MTIEVFGQKYQSSVQYGSSNDPNTSFFLSSSSSTSLHPPPSPSPSPPSLLLSLPSLPPFLSSPSLPPHPPHIFRGASSSSSIGWLRKMSLAFRHRPFTSFSANCTVFIVRVPRARREGGQGRSDRRWERREREGGKTEGGRGGREGRREEGDEMREEGDEMREGEKERGRGEVCINFVYTGSSGQSSKA